MRKKQKISTALALAIITGCTVVCSIIPQGIEANAQTYSVVRDEKIIYRGHTYAFMDAREKNLNTYYAVEEYCRSLGGHLAVINDYDENDFLFSTLQNSFSKTAFFGYSDEDRESVWVWTGPNSDFENWTRNSRWYMPDNGREYGGDEDYAEFNYERGKDWLPNDGTWNDAPFRDNTDFFICEWEYEDSFSLGCYEDLINQYKEALEFYRAGKAKNNIDDNNREFVKHNYPQVNEELLYDSVWNGTGLSYALYDINHDGSSELLISYAGPEGGTFGALYTCKNDKVITLVTDISYRTYCWACPDGTIVEYGSGGALYAVAYIYKINAAGDALDHLSTYDIDAEKNPSAPCYNGEEWLTFDEFFTKYKENDESVYNWITM